ncbi:efflux RND transporter periplasmic adaptor subunit [Roseovarius spongiae]|uniref:Efflux RND transporter periplasmic adaptor subunit n=1 Tax=Roseovarius spongiae TaxID=2320272 RepID=A0A3A8B847_9RHOB|nr:efflux RND transporter periplasmic adaptor subunit [Roseovarius spongiae]RKF13424.1 efflux RND transporter periplasmic adaptor subunit [Roseovarius spongiae]
MIRWTRPALLIAALACAAPLTAQTAQEAAKPVKLMTLGAGDKRVEREFFGHVVARQTVDLAFQVAGQIVEFPVLEGQTVPEGGLIAKLDMQTFELALDQARLRQEQADRTVARLNRLSDASASEVRREDAATEAGLARIAVANAEYALEHATLHAPFDALVAAREVANYTTVTAGKPIVRLHDMSELRIEIDVPEILFQRVGEDPDVSITATFPVSDRAYPVEIREFNAETSAIGQTFRLTFGMPPPDGLRVLPGSSVTITARIRQGDAELYAPASAIATAADGATSVLKFTPGAEDTGTLSRIPVKVSAGIDGRLSIEGDVAAGDEIVAAGVSMLEDGMTVRRFTGFPN